MKAGNAGRSCRLTFQSSTDYNRAELAVEKREDIVKKIGVVIAFALLLCTALGGCFGTETEALPTTIKSADNRISLSVPEGWSEYSAEIKDNMALAVQDGERAFAQIFWYPNVEGKDLTAQDYVSEAAEYYGDYVTGSAAKITVVNTDDGYYFAYKMTVKDEAGNAETYQGYEFFVTFPGGVAEVDTFFKFTDDEPTNDELAVLRDIAQTIRVK